MGHYTDSCHGKLTSRLGPEFGAAETAIHPPESWQHLTNMKEFSFPRCRVTASWNARETSSGKVCTWTLPKACTPQRNSEVRRWWWWPWWWWERRLTNNPSALCAGHCGKHCKLLTHLTSRQPNFIGIFNNLESGQTGTWTQAIKVKKGNYWVAKLVYILVTAQSNQQTLKRLKLTMWYSWGMQICNVSLLSL